MADPQRPPPRRWLLIGTQRMPQCFLYRVEQKQSSSRPWAGRAVCFSRRNSRNGPRHNAWVGHGDLSRLEVSLDLLDWIQAARDRGIPRLYDIDDLLFDPSHSPPLLEHYAGRFTPPHPLCLGSALITGDALLRCRGCEHSNLADRWRSLRPPATTNN